MKEDRAEMKKIMAALVIEEKREETVEIHSISNSILFFSSFYFFQTYVRPGEKFL